MFLVLDLVWILNQIQNSITLKFESQRKPKKIQIKLAHKFENDFEIYVGNFYERLEVDLIFK